MRPSTWAVCACSEPTRRPVRARERLLADAERAFLSVADEGQGRPDYHLGLGVTYYRLEKRDKGDAELGQVLALNQPVQTLSVARAYRSLGIEDKAKTIAKPLTASSNRGVADAACHLMALMADTVPRRKSWLERIKTKSAAVRAELSSITAALAWRKGDLKTAAAGHQRSYEAWKSYGDNDSAAINNRAIAIISKYQLTGDVRDLDVAVRDLETAARIAPDSALGVANLADALTLRGLVRFLDRWIEPERVPLTSSDAMWVVGGLLNGPEDAAVRAALDAPEIRRSREQARRARTLAPARRAATRPKRDWPLSRTTSSHSLRY